MGTGYRLIHAEEVVDIPHDQPAVQLDCLYEAPEGMRWIGTFTIDCDADNASWALCRSYDTSGHASQLVELLDEGRTLWVRHAVRKTVDSGEQRIIVRLAMPAIDA